MKAYWINATERTVTEVDSGGLADLQRMVGGYIEIAKYWPNGDVMFVDEEGLMKGGTTWFRIPGTNNPICGNGVVVGPEDDDGNTEPPTFPLSALQAEVTFITPDQVAAWAKGNSSEPAITFYTPGEEPTVISRVSDLFDSGPPAKKTDRKSEQ
ncbi:DUF3846 domain-containing protein [Rhodopila sp.]|uniref:DUF3846 domain-containing protein n=1 Tax=Rhodopila sp. TaxID=2480087 RepID=UPI003D0996BD